VTLNRNPYQDPLADPADAAEYENGYQYAQELGHQLLSQAGIEDAEAWSRGHPESWVRGFATGASRLGVGRLARMLFAEEQGMEDQIPEEKRAEFALDDCWATTYLSGGQKKEARGNRLAGGLLGAGLGAGMGALGLDAIEEIPGMGDQFSAMTGPEAAVMGGGAAGAGAGMLAADRTEKKRPIVMMGPGTPGGPRVIP